MIEKRLREPKRNSPNGDLLGYYLTRLELEEQDNPGWESRLLKIVNHWIESNEVRLADRAFMRDNCARRKFGMARDGEHWFTWTWDFYHGIPLDHTVQLEQFGVYTFFQFLLQDDYRKGNPNRPRIRRCHLCNSWFVTVQGKPNTRYCDASCRSRASQLKRAEGASEDTKEA